MLYLSLEDVQKEMPLAKIYAWSLNYYPELEVYRATMWMNLPYRDADKCQFVKFIPVSFAPSKQHMLKFLKVALKAELKSVTKKGLKKIEGS